jgi:uncharacterized repeat protein (TIGR03803 family)
MRPRPRASAPVQIFAFFAILALFMPAVSAASKHKVLYAFKAGTDGNSPSGALVFDAAGNLYGTTINGGSTGTCLYGQGIGCGIVFELTPKPNGKWKESVLHRFQGGSDGANPNGSPVFDATGNLYGATLQGGTGTSDGCGTIFQLAPSSDGWTESLAFTFCDNGDGYFPNPGLSLDGAGNIYGTTESGGGELGGIAFELTPSSGGWTEIVIHDFCLVGGCSGMGAQPEAGLTIDADGNLYGTTVDGGQTNFGCFNDFPPGCGVVFKLTAKSGGGWTDSLLRRFKGPDGAGPGSNLIFDTQGNLYGTTSFDGAFGFGTVFKLTPSSHGRWTETVLYNFRSRSGQGAINSGVVLDAAGNLYGATNPDNNCCGVVYRLSPGKNGRWKYSPLHTFSGGPDGGQPSGSLIFDQQGNLYGTAKTGGNGAGVVFEVTP